MITPSNSSIAINQSIEMTSTIPNAIWTATLGSFGAGANQYKKIFQSGIAGIGDIKVSESVWGTGPHFQKNADDSLTILIGEAYWSMPCLIVLNSPGDYVEKVLSGSGAFTESFRLLQSGDTWAWETYNGFYFNGTPINTGLLFYAGETIRFTRNASNQIEVRKNGALVFTFAQAAASSPINVGWNLYYGNWEVGTIIPPIRFGGPGITGMTYETTTVNVLGPVSTNFTIPATMQASDNLIPTNLSVNATTYQWKVNGKNASPVFQPNLASVLKMGTNEISLTASNANESKTVSKHIEVTKKIITVANTNNHPHQNLPPKSEFKYRVRAKDAAGNLSGWSNQITGETA